MEIEWITIFLPIAIEIAELLFRLVLIPAIILGIAWIRDRIKNRIIRDIIADAVRYAQQVFWEHDGQARLDQAIAYAIRQLAKWKIELTEQELRDLIEPILKELKDAVGDTWYEGNTE